MAAGLLRSEVTRFGSGKLPSKGRSFEICFGSKDLEAKRANLSACNEESRREEFLQFAYFRHRLQKGALY